MAYTKQTWTDLPATTSPINATRLNHIEDGIYENSNDITTLNTTTTNLSTNKKDVYPTILYMDDYSTWPTLAVAVKTHQEYDCIGRIGRSEATNLRTLMTNPITNANYTRVKFEIMYSADNSNNCSIRITAVDVLSSEVYTRYLSYNGTNYFVSNWKRADS